MTSMLMQGDSCAVSMDGVNMSGPAKRAARLRLYQFMMVIIILVVAFHAVALFIPWFIVVCRKGLLRSRRST
jgi:hypothetical protein